MHRGFIKIYRNFEDWALYKHDGAVLLLIHLLLKATHKERKISFMGKPYMLQPGQLTTGRAMLAEQTGLSQQRIRTLLAKLQEFGEIDIKSTSKCSLVTLIKWEQFQSQENYQPANIPTSNQQTTNEQPAINQQTTTKQECKEIKKEKNVKNEEEVNTIVKIWNDFAERYDLSQIVKITDKRKRHVMARSKEKEFDLQAVLQEIENSDFLLGRKTEWKVDFDFIFCSASNYIKILEGKYKNVNKTENAYKKLMEVEV